MKTVSENLKKVKSNIENACAKTGRSSSQIKLVVVTKSANIEQIKCIVRLGEKKLGENRVQHLKLVADELADVPDIQWHMLGHLQRNKAKQLLKISNFIHSVDTLRLAEELSSICCKSGVVPEILLQVNCSQEPQKYGVPVGAAIHLAEQIATLPNLRLAGLMTMAPLTLNKDAIKSSFSRAQELFEEIKGEKIATPHFRHLSMGMSQDYELAIEYGSTMLRIGSAIFA